MALRAEKIRDFNRFYTNFIGLVNQTILQSPYSLAEVRVMLEIDKAGTCSAADLTKIMQIDAGYLSRMLNRFIKEQLVTRTKSSKDGRSHILKLTEKGKATFHALSSSATRQIVDLLSALPERSQNELIDHMQAIRSILEKPASDEITIRTAKPGDLGYIAFRHGVLYEQEYQLEPVFESYVLEGLLKYVRSSQEGTVWMAEHGGKIAGFIAIIRIDEETAQLRWFLIEPEFRGIGLGRRLMSIAMDYCREKQFRQVFLWTFQGLDAACHLYEAYGFRMTEQARNDTWKKGVVEERWELNF